MRLLLLKLSLFNESYLLNYKYSYIKFYLNLINLAAASCYIELIIKESDNNVKLIVLDRLDELREKHDQTLDDLVLDILRVLTRYSQLKVKFIYLLICTLFIKTNFHLQSGY